MNEDLPTRLLTEANGRVKFSLSKATSLRPEKTEQQNSSPLNTPATALSGVIF